MPEYSYGLKTSPVYTEAIKGESCNITSNFFYSPLDPHRAREQSF